MMTQPPSGKNIKYVHLVSLGCARNLVDSELMIGRLSKSGWIACTDPAQARAIIVNTCSFIEPAIDESIDTILELAVYKHQGSCERLIVIGCLPERFREEIVRALPEVDLFLGTGAYDQIVSALEDTGGRSECRLPDPNRHPLQTAADPRVRSTLHQAYLKIAEGCTRRCSYCIIPKLRGRLRSRPLMDIIEEARHLIESGVKEITLIAQDSTAYGSDLTPPADLSRLLSGLSSLSEDTWIRFLYGHPASLDERTIQTVAGLPNVCSYFDVPIQHASDRILKRMNRGYTQNDLYQMVDTIRKLDPHGAIRTTAIVGFPGETPADFEQLVTFAETVRFDHLGTFLYSDSSDLSSHKLPDHVPEQTAQDRQDQLMFLQSEISLKNNQKRVGNTYRMLVEKQINPTLFSGRTFFQAPEVDGETTVGSAHLEPGRFIDIAVTQAHDYDLTGEPA